MFLVVESFVPDGMVVSGKGRALLQTAIESTSSSLSEMPVAECKDGHECPRWARRNWGRRGLGSRPMSIQHK